MLRLHLSHCVDVRCGYCGRCVKSSHSVCFRMQSVSLHDLFCFTFGSWIRLQLDTRQIWSFGKTEASDPAGKLLGAHRVESSTMFLDIKEPSAFHVTLIGCLEGLL